MATDLSTHFSRYNFLSDLVENNAFFTDVPEHRIALMGAMMVGANLCGVCKPWDTSQLIARLVYDEYCARVHSHLFLCPYLFIHYIFYFYSNSKFLICLTAIIIPLLTAMKILYFLNE